MADVSPDALSFRGFCERRGVVLPLCVPRAPQRILGGSLQTSSPLAFPPLSGLHPDHFCGALL